MSEVGLASEISEAAAEPAVHRTHRSIRDIPDVAWDLGAVGLIVLGAVLRFWGLTRQSMWYDELFAVTIVDNSLGAVISAAASDTSPPLYYLAQSLLIRLMGITDFSMRILPAVAGALTVVVVYLLGRRCFSPRVGFVSTALFAVGFLPLRYAQEARGYSFLMLFSALSLLTLVRLYEKVTIGRAIAYCLCLIAMCYTHVYGALAAAGIVAASLLVPALRQRIGWRGLLAGIVAGLAFVPWALVVLVQMSKVQSWVADRSWPIPRPEQPADALLKTLGSLAPWPDEFALAAAVVFGALAFAALLPRFDPPDECSTIGKDDKQSASSPDASGGSRLPESAGVWLLGLSVLLPLGFGLILSVTTVPIHNVRNSIVVLPALYTLVAIGLFRIWRPLAFVVVAGLLALTVTGISGYYAETPRGYSREAAQYLLDQGANRDLVIVSNYMLPLNLNVYAKILGGDQFWLAEVPAQLDGPELDARIASALKDRKRVWIATMFLESDGAGRNAFQRSMSRQPGWVLISERDFDKKPIVQEWGRQ